MIKSPFIFGAQHISIEEWIADLKEIAETYENSMISTHNRAVTREKARRLINFKFFIDALPTILRD